MSYHLALNNLDDEEIPAFSIFMTQIQNKLIGVKNPTFLGARDKYSADHFSTETSM